MSKRVYWIARHPLTAAQNRAIRDLHGEDVEIVHEAITFQDDMALARLLEERTDGFVYAVAGIQHFLNAVDVDHGHSVQFGIFANHPGKRANGTFGLAAVYHWLEGALFRVWHNPDPESDHGDRLL